MFLYAPWGGGQQRVEPAVPHPPAVLAQAPSAGGHGDVHAGGLAAGLSPRPSMPAPPSPSPAALPELDLAHSRYPGRGWLEDPWIPVTWTDLLPGRGRGTGESPLRAWESHELGPQNSWGLGRAGPESQS